jgi:hypothetical protein
MPSNYRGIEDKLDKTTSLSTWGTLTTFESIASVRDDGYEVASKDIDVTLDVIRAISAIRDCKPLLRKSYGLELILILRLAHYRAWDNGIDDTYNFLISSKPRREAFSRFVGALIEKGILETIPSSTKRSKKSSDFGVKF